MKKLIYRLTPVLIITCLLSCSKDKFASLNTNPDVTLNIPPEYELSTGLINIFSNNNERYYDYDLGIYYWDQTFVLGTGNNLASYQGSGNIGQRWGIFYGGVGDKLTDIKQIIQKLPTDDQAKYVYLNAIVDIPLAYYAWYTSDVYDYIPYSQAFKARYTVPPLLTPVYDPQSELFDRLDSQVKAAIVVLESTPAAPQADLSGYDVYYQGDVTKWIKAANSLRLRMAFRLMKRNPEKLQAIATEVFADNVGPIASSADNWAFIAGPGAFTGADANPSNQRPVSGSKNMVDFMWNTQDPRLRIFYYPSLTKDQFDSAKAQGQLPAGLVWDGQLYRGQFASPDAALVPANAVYFTPINYSYKGVQTATTWNSGINSDFFNSAPNSGNATFRIITYADMCFMRAELAQRGMIGSSADAETWYYAGIDASLAEYDAEAALMKMPVYTPLTAGEVSAYKAAPGVVFDPTNALEQIAVQQYISYYKNNSEAWAIIKRTGFPSTTGNIMKLETFSVSGDVQSMPRRFSISPPSVTDLNFENISNALTAMQADAGFGIPSDITGRVWWDMQ